ncbi:MAG: hypothetical protein ACFE94_17165 [Candidatus Hodarchaeota archaeon]
MGAGRIIAIIGGIVGILSIGLYHLLPELFCLWRLDASPILQIWIGGFGFEAGEVMGIGSDPEYTEEILLLIIGALTVGGGALSIIGGITESKIIGILGGIVMLAGPVLFIIGAAIEFGPFEDLAALIPPGENLLFGSQAGGDWGLWIGTYLAIGGGVVGLIGGFLTEA